MTCQNCQREIAADSNFCYLCGARQVARPAGPLIGKRWMRSVVDYKIAGVCGGIAEYFEIDSTVVRLVWILLVLMPVPVVPAILGYLVAWMVMPKAPSPVTSSPVEKDSHSAPGAAPHSAQPA